MEGAVFDSQAIRGLIGIDLACESAANTTALLQFRRPLEAHGLTRAMFETINAHLAAKGLLLQQGSVVDGALISAPTSTKNASSTRDPGTYKMGKGPEGCFGMKAHIGAELVARLVLTRVCTATNVFADAGPHCADKRTDATTTRATWPRNPAHGSLCKTQPRVGKPLNHAERLKASVLANVEHPLHIIKNLIKLRKFRYRELAKSAAQLHTPFGPANLLTTKSGFSELQARRASW
jgi:IS5 family transposase